MRRLLTTLVLSLAAGCAGVEGTPVVDCDPNGACPSGFTCDSKTNRCVTSGSTQTPDAATLVGLTLAVTGAGTIQVSGQATCVTASCAYSVPLGESITLTAVPRARARTSSSGRAAVPAPARPSRSRRTRASRAPPRSRRGSRRRRRSPARAARSPRVRPTPARAAPPTCARSTPVPSLVASRNS